MHRDPDSIDARIARLGDVFSLHEARAEGVSASSLSRRVIGGRLGSPFRAVFTRETGELSERTLLRAALLAGGPHSAISHVTSLRLRGWWDRDHGGTLHVTSVTSHHRRHHPRMTFHATAALPECDQTLVDGLVHTSAARSCHDAGLCLDPFQLAAVIREAAFCDALHIEDLRARVEEYVRAPGNGVVRTAVALHAAGCAGTRSRSEDKVRVGMARARFPAPLVNTRGATGHPELELDFVWPALRVVMEVDGDGSHLRQPGASERDAAIDARLRADGWSVLRVPASLVWTELPSVLSTIRGLLRS